MIKKNKKESFMKGIVVLIVAQVLIKVIGFAYKIYITNREGFGDKGNAIYNAGFSIYALLLTISSVGVPNAVAKLVSEKLSRGEYEQVDRIFKVALVTFAVIGCIGSMILFFGAEYIANIWLKIPEAELTLVALSPSIFFVSIICVIRGYFNGMQQLTPTANSQIIEQLFKTVLTIIFVEFVAIISGVNTEVMAAGANLATTFATIVGLIYLLNYYKKNKNYYSVMRIERKLQKKSVWAIIKEILFVSIPISLSSVLSSINGNIDAITVKRNLMKFLTEEVAQKQYGILSGKVTTLITLPLSFNIAFATALVPAISAAKAGGQIDLIKKRVSFSILASIIIGLPCVVGMISYGDSILKLLFPNQSQGAMILQISSIGIIFMVLEQTINGVLQGLGKLFIPAIALGTGVIVKLILNLILIPIEEIGILGASIGTVGCHFISFLIGFNSLKKNIEINFKFSKFILKPVIATAVMLILSNLLYIYLQCIINPKMSIILVLIFAIMVYIITLFILKTFSKEEIFMLPYGCKIYHKVKRG
ncbi:MAG: polysaccharide biosynthesis protein [Clostridia bacterium]|nr:polysaccharide biosynthesis protein [Clostridia bacterium]